ncbi:MAG: SdpI family protein [Syntrophales bacterium]|nr:SdpI family protein [Syntrophales bacterium]
MMNQPFFIPALLIFLLSIPLIGGFIPPNRGYGIRTAKTLSDPQLWYRANKFGGWALLLASGFYLAVAALTLDLPSANKDFAIWLFHLGSFCLPLLVSFLLIRRYIKKL